VFERAHESRLCFALFAWFAQAALLATGKACNKCKTLGQLGLVCFQILLHKCSFPNSNFFILVVKNNKTSSLQALTAKPVIAFPEIV